MWSLLAQQMDSGLHGFLPTRGSFMLDFVFTAMFAVLVVLGWSIFLVRYRRKYALHKRIQLALAVVLLAAVSGFEIDMRFFTDWEQRAAASPFFVPGRWNAVWSSLAVHLCFAVPTTFLWAFVVVQALRRFPRPVSPSDYSAKHVFWARLAALGMLMTAVTGWLFYWLAFVA